MNFKFLVLIIFIFLVNACAQDVKNAYTTTEQVIVYDSTKTSQPRYYIPKSEVNQGDTIIFIASRIETPVIFLIPRADELFVKNESYRNYEEDIIEGVIFLRIIVNRKSNWQSEKFIIKSNPKQDEEVKYHYGAYLPEEFEWAEGDSSPVIIVRPGS